MVAIPVPWPLSNSPGQKPQEGAGKLINVYAEPRGENAGVVWHRVPGAAVFSRAPSVGAASIAFNANAVGST